MEEKSAKIITPVKVCKAFDPKQIPPGQVPHHATNALWDTGATNSVITETTARQLNLTPIGMTKMNHAGGISYKNKYLINIVLPNRVGMAGIEVCDMPDNSNDFGILIGMDVISQGDFSISNFNKDTWFSFRMPSLAPIDFVVEINNDIQ
jgi:hypothetical protein